MAKKSFRLVFQSIKDELLDYSVREKALLIVESFITFITSFAAMIINFVAKEMTLGYITLGFSMIALLLLVLELVLFTASKKIKNKPFLYTNFFLTYVLVILYLVFAPKNGLFLYWIVSFPLILSVVGGLRRGIFYSLILLVIIILFFYVPPINTWMIGKETESTEEFATFKIFFILNYLMTLILGMAIAYVNDTFVKRLSALKEDYYRDANTDITTGLKNQMYFISYVNALPDELTEGDTIGLMFIDIDDFKVYNDKFGHTVGNEVLIKVAKKLNDIPHSLLVRWGGDEFAIIERNISREEFIAKANYLLKSVEGSCDGVTISIGLAFYKVDENFDFNKIFDEADMKTIRAKGKGKNCLVIND